MSGLPRGYVAYAVLLLFLVNAANYGQRMIVSILLPAIQADVALSDAQLGMLMGGGFALVYSLAGVPLARLADRGVRRTFLAGALAFWSAATASFALATGFTQMLLARIALGVGESVCVPTSHTLLTDLVSPEARPFAFGLHSTGAVVGATAALMLGGYLGASFGWRHAMWLAALPGFVLAAFLVLTLREPPRSVSGQDAMGQTPLKAVISHLTSLRSYVFVLIAVCLAMLVEFGLNQWLPSYYVRQFGLSIREVGFQYGLACAVGGIPGSLLGGWVTSRLLRRDVRWLVWFPALTYAIAIPLGWSMLLADSAALALVLNGLYAFAIYSTNGAFWAACFAAIPNRMRATTSAITLLVAGIVGLAVGPVLVGMLSDLFSSVNGHHSLQNPLLVVESLGLLVIIALFCAAHWIRSDTGAVTPRPHPIAPPATEIL